MEITPGKEAYQNYFFDKADLNASGAKSALEGQTLCFYGPWVNDEVHGTHPEIHPSELLWWQEKDNANSGTFLPSWWLLGVTDESERFLDRHDFPGAPQGERWLPWAAKPRHAKWRFLIDKAANDIVSSVFSASSSLDTTGLADLDLNAR